MKLLVTGAAGFIGSNFVYYMLQSQPELMLIGFDSLTYAGNLENLAALQAEDKKRFHFIKADITDAAAVAKVIEEEAIDVVVNFAAESHVDRSIHDPQVFLRTNVLGTQTLLDACRQLWRKDGQWVAGKKFVQVSTDEVYGSLGPTGEFTESTPIDPHSPYSASKAGADLLVRAYHDTFGMPIAITRCSNNYGPYQFPEKLIPLMIHNALQHRDLPVYGDGRQVRDWLHVSDHCRAIEAVLMRAESGSVYNIGGRNEWENIAIVNKIIEILRDKTQDQDINDGLIRHVEDRLGHDRRYAIDASHIQHDLGWEPSIGFAEGIEGTIQWYLDHRQWTENVISGEYQRFYEANYAHR